MSNKTLSTLGRSMKQADKDPQLGVTQGGSSRTRGAKVAATTAGATKNEFKIPRFGGKDGVG